MLCSSKAATNTSIAMSTAAPAAVDMALRESPLAVAALMAPVDVTASATYSGEEIAD